jgi:hypothetical protein
MFKSLKTQNQLREYARKNMHEIGECTSVIKYHPEKWDLFMYLFERHSDYPEKFNGLIDIQIKYNPIYKKQLETIIIKDNGTKDDVSVLNNCITGKPKDNLTVAMRNAIVSQIYEFKNNASLICELCESIENIHIDHYKPQFVDLKTAFLNDWQSTIPNIFEQNESHSKIFISDDICFETKWFDYHQKNATLRVLCKKCNLSRKKSNGNIINQTL